MATGNFVSYLRVSTAQQGKSGLGLSAQRAAVDSYLNGGEWDLLEEFVEVESGKRKDRPQLAAALNACRATGSTLVVAKLDRLARNVSFISQLLDSGVKFIAVDLPNADRFMFHILASVAEKEAAMISQRTRDALAQAKVKAIAEGRGWTRPNNLTEAAKKAGGSRSGEIRKAKAVEHAASILDEILKLKKEGNSLRTIAAKLTEGKRLTPSRKSTEWKATMVKRIIDNAANQKQKAGR